MDANKPLNSPRRTLRVDSTAESGRPENLAGFLVVDKPEGVSSMAAVAAVRRRAGKAKTGHAGTLDPLATGVLVIGIGRAATKHLGSIMIGGKQYETDVDLSCFSTTDDREGETIACDRVEPPDEAIVRETVSRFVGIIRQRPPAHSAIKIDGRAAYKSARRGKMIDIPSREVRCDGIDIREYRWPLLRMCVRCGKGFYIRSLARELGEALGTGGYCLSIRRTAVEPFTLDEATPLDALPQRITQRDLIDVTAAIERVDRRPDPAV